MNINDSWKFVYEVQKKASLLAGTISLLDWDQKTYMPKKGIEDRALQISILSEQIHDMMISDNLWKHLEFLSKERNAEKLQGWQRIILERFKKDVERSRKVPPDFIKRSTLEESVSYSSWEEAKRRSRFDIFSTHLKRLLDLKREYCRYMGLEGHIYNNLLDDYEEGMRFEILKPSFDYLKSKITRLLDKLADSDVDNDMNIRINLEKQKRLVKIIPALIGLKKDRFRFDVSEHPFTTRLSTYDVRITTRYIKDRPLSSLFSTLHEAGHALYEMNMPRGRYRYTVISDAPSLGLHESQSRFWENIIGRSYSFWKFFYPIFREESNLDIGRENLYRYINRVRRSLIRVDADEISYNLHIILRFEIEADLIDGKIKVDDLPEIWNKKMEDLIGVRPKTDREGVLQDMHWSVGDFGYFPTYTIGNIYSAQQFYRMKGEIENFYQNIEEGKFREIISWLKENIHRYGRMFTSEEIIKRSCGEGLNPKVFIRYIEEKFSDGQIL